MSRYESWRRDLDKVVPLQCGHPREYVSDSHSTDSDTLILVIWCPDCRTSREDEVIGSLARAMAEDDAESKRPLFYEGAA